MCSLTLDALAKALKASKRDNLPDGDWLGGDAQYHSTCMLLARRFAETETERVGFLATCGLGVQP